MVEAVAWYLLAGIALGIVFDWCRGEPAKYSLWSVLWALLAWPVVAVGSLYVYVWRPHPQACWRATAAVLATLGVLRVFNLI